MSSPTANPDVPATRRFVCWLAVLCLLLQSIWLPLHLASERHFVVGLELAERAPSAPSGDATTAPSAAAPDALATASADLERDDAPAEPPHSAFDHQQQKRTVSDDDEAAASAHAPFAIAWCDDVVTLPGLGRAPPRLVDFGNRPVQSDGPPDEAAPRAPPTAA